LLHTFYTFYGIQIHFQFTKKKLPFQKG